MEAIDYLAPHVFLTILNNLGLIIMQNRKVEKVNSIIHLQVLPAIHLEEPSDVHVIKKRSLDQQLRIKLYYDESVYRFVASITKKL